ncbi:amidohydrolase [Chryseolinea soli]|uniref:Amidohydrolase n=1 Tax=Chryseolinea soli TaxID=2321403 RepID=A0A385SHT2_9BACT|nr:amidohydrolase [Chryseolinea soli]AYB30452.1 amidohydrolase [Chryseolinea soli]
MHRLFFLLALAIAGGALQAQTKASQKILFNGKIFTANPNQPVAEAVALSGDKIIAVGSMVDVQKALKGETTQIDLQGKFLLPGLIDSHNHALSGGKSLSAANVGDVWLATLQLAAYAENILKTRKGMRGDVILIEGMHSATWAHLNELDALFNGDGYRKQPVVLRGSDGHTAWVNRVMLQRAGVNRAFITSLNESERPFFGVDEKGEPTGRISEDGFNTIRKVLPASAVDAYEAARAGVQHLNSLGITAWLDPATGSTGNGAQNSDLQLYEKLSLKKNLTAHVAATVVADGDGDIQKQIDVLKALQMHFNTVKDLSVLGFKIFADGVLEYPTQTAAVSIPYKNSGRQGSLMFEPGKFKNFVAKADQQQLLVHVHAIGDRAVTEALNAFAYARAANGNNRLSHFITHLQLVVPSDFKRFAALNVLASYQLLWATADTYTVELVKPYIDSTLFAVHYPAKSMLDQGAVIAGASDWPVSSANPFEAIYVAETRLGKLGVLNPRESMPRAEMLKAYTINAAKVLWNTTIGSIEPGKQADLVLVDRDVLTVSAEDVKTTQVLWTMFGGEIVYKK